MATERTDPLAALVAEVALHAALVPVLKAEMGRLGLRMYEGPDARTIAAAVGATYTARMERRDGQRRVVLYGEWTVDPSAVTATHVPRAAA